MNEQGISQNQEKKADLEPQNGGGRAGGQRVIWGAVTAGTLWPGLGQGAADLTAGGADQKG